MVSSSACSRVNACRWCISMLDILMSCSLMYLVLESPMIMIFLSGLGAAVMVLSLLFSSSLCFFSSSFCFCSCSISLCCLSLFSWSSSFCDVRISSSCLFWCTSWFRLSICLSLMVIFSSRLVIIFPLRSMAFCSCLFSFFASLSCRFRWSALSLPFVLFSLGLFFFPDVFPVCS